jgi:hypothetical protein
MGQKILAANQTFKAAKRHQMGQVYSGKPLSHKQIAKLSLPPLLPLKHLPLDARETCKGIVEARPKGRTTILIAKLLKHWQASIKTDDLGAPRVFQLKHQKAVLGNANRGSRNTKDRVWTFF